MLWIISLMTSVALCNFSVKLDEPFPLSFGHENRDLTVQCLAYLKDYIAAIASLDNGLGTLLPAIYLFNTNDFQLVQADQFETFSSSAITQCSSFENKLHLYGENTATGIKIDMDAKNIEIFVKLDSVTLKFVTYDLSSAKFVRNAFASSEDDSYAGFNIIHNSQNVFFVWNLSKNRVFAFFSAVYEHPILTGVSNQAQPFALQLEAKSVSDKVTKSYFMYDIGFNANLVESQAQGRLVQNGYVTNNGDIQIHCVESQEKPKSLFYTIFDFQTNQEHISEATFFSTGGPLICLDILIQGNNNQKIIWTDGADIIIANPNLGSDKADVTRYSNGFSSVLVSPRAAKNNLVLFQVQEFYGTSSNFKFGIIFNYLQEKTCISGKTSEDTTSFAQMLLNFEQPSLVTHLTQVNSKSDTPQTTAQTENPVPISFTQPYSTCTRQLSYDGSLPSEYPEESIAGTLSIRYKEAFKIKQNWDNQLLSRDTVKNAEVFRESDNQKMDGVQLIGLEEEVKLDLSKFQDGLYYLVLEDVNGLFNEEYEFSLVLKDLFPSFVQIPPAISYFSINSIDKEDFPIESSDDIHVTETKIDTTGKPMAEMICFLTNQCGFIFDNFKVSEPAKFDFVAEVTDNARQTTRQEFSIVVHGFNTKPFFLQSIPKQIVQVPNTLKVVVEYQDYDINDSLSTITTFRGSNIDSQSFISSIKEENKETLYFDFPDNKLLGTYEVVVQVEDDDTNLTGTREKATMSFQIEILPFNYAPEFSPVSTVSCKLNEECKFLFPQFSDQNPGDSFNYNFNLDRPQGSTLIPTFYQDGSITIQPTEDVQVGEYTINWEVNDDNSIGGQGQQTSYINQQLTIQNTDSAPQFMQTVPDFQLFQLETSILSFPSFLDTNKEDSHQLLFDFGDLENSVDFNSETQIFTISPQIDTLPGVYRVQLEVREDKKYQPLSDTLNFDIKILQKEFKCQFEWIYPDLVLELNQQVSSVFINQLNEQENCQKEAQFDFLLQDGSDVPGFFSFKDSLITLKPVKEEDIGPYFVVPQIQAHDKVYQLSVFKIYVFQEGVMNLMNFATDTQEEKEDFSIIQIDQQGEVTLSFRQEMVLFSPKQINSQTFDITILEEGLYENRDLIESWNTTYFTENEMKIQLYFFEPLEISSTYFDSLSIKIIDSQFLIVKEELRKLKEEQVLQQQIPPQLPRSDDKMLTQIGSSIKGVMYGFVTANTVICIFCAASLQLIWKMLSTIQVLVHFPLFSFPFPANVIKLFSLIINLANFQIIKLHFLEKWFGNLQQQTEKEVMMENFGYSNSLIASLGLVFIFMLISLVFILLGVLIFRIFKHSIIIKTIGNIIRDKIFFNPILRAFIQTYLTLSLASLYNCQNLSLESFPNTISSILALLSFLLVFISPLIIQLLLVRKLETLGLLKTRQKFGSLYLNLKVNRKTQISYNLIFMYRRLIMSLTIVLFQALPVIQIGLNCLISVFVLSYTLSVQPFEKLNYNLLEIFNDLCLLSISYLVYCFTGIVSQPELKYELGKVTIYLFLANLAANVINILFSITLILVNFYKKKRKNKKFSDLHNTSNLTNQTLLFQLDQYETPVEKQKIEDYQKEKRKSNTKKKKKNESGSLNLTQKMRKSQKKSKIELKQLQRGNQVNDRKLKFDNQQNDFNLQGRNQALGCQNQFEIQNIDLQFLEESKLELETKRERKIQNNIKGYKRSIKKKIQRRKGKDNQ